MNGVVIQGVELEAPHEMQVLNFKTTGVHRFINQKRIGPVNELILHETVTSSAKATLDVLQQRNLGVHFIVGGDGSVYQHGDAKDDLLWHASEHNPKSVGIEVVNPYYPELRPTNGIWDKVIKAPWAHRGSYVVPPLDQVEVLTFLVEWLSSSAAAGLDIPAKWAGVHDQRMLMGISSEATGPGIYAHHYFGHADGCWLALYTWLRLVARLDPETAYEDACSLATGAVGSVDLSPYFAENLFIK
jgi:hypothetical protein